MKKSMKRLVSVLAVMVMLVSMLSTFAFSAVAKEADGYKNLLKSAFVVNPAWDAMEDGDAISFMFNGKKEVTFFDSNFHFADFDSAWAAAKKMKVDVPSILLCAGEYTEEINIDGAVNLLGPNAGINPVVKSASYDIAWSKAERDPEAIIKANVIIDKKTQYGNITIDGLAFGAGGAYLDYERDRYNSELVVKNTVFEGAGNKEEAKGYVFFLRNGGHARKVNFENLYITGTNLAKPNANGTTVGFIGAFYSELYAKNIAYIDNINGFIAKSWFADGVDPVVEITDSCFYNDAELAAAGYAVSVDAGNYGIGYKAAGTPGDHTVSDLVITASTQRARTTVKINNNIFYNASSSNGVVRMEMVNVGSYLEMVDNYFVSTQDVLPFLDPEFLVDSKAANQSSCFRIRNNRLINTYMIPDMEGSSENTYIDLTANYFGTADGRVAYVPVYVNEEYPRVIRSYFWVDEAMTIKSSAWDLTLGGSWPFATLDNLNYSSNVVAYSDQNNEMLDIQYKAAKGLKVQLYKSADFDDNGVVTRVYDPIEGINQDVLSNDIYKATQLYVQVSDKNYSNFAPVYLINVSNSGRVDTKDFFADKFPNDYAIICDDVALLEAGTMYPYRWQGEIYKFIVGKNIFATIEEAIAAKNAEGYEIPHILLPAASYVDPVYVPASCTILGEQHGVNPNSKPFDVIAKDDFTRSVWTLNGARANNSMETCFNAPVVISDDANDYIITFDGVMFGENSAFYDQGIRTDNNVVVFKNTRFENAGHTLLNNQTSNTLFNLKKNGTDMFSMYLYDCRIDGLESVILFSYYNETLVIDGTFIGNFSGTSYMFSGYKGREYTDHYTSITNSYLYNFDQCRTASNAAYYVWSTADSSTTQNIVYNFNNNVFYNTYSYGYAAMEFKFTGTNMKFYYTNNIVYSDTNADQLLAVGSNRFTGNCAKQDLSNMIIIKGNRFIKLNRMFSTVDSGPGTMYDFSGNYYAASIGASTGLTPTNGALRFQTNTGVADTYRVKMDYTFVDWNMTVRSDAVASDNGLEYTYVGDGTVATELDGGKSIEVYRDSVSSDAIEYPIPVSVGEYSSYKIYRNADLSGATTSILTLNEAENVYYFHLSNQDGSETKTIKVVITRPLNSEAKVYGFDSFIVDEEKAEITGYIRTPLYAYRATKVSASAGAKLDLFVDEACTTVSSYTIFASSGAPVERYLRVISEDENAEKLYKVTFLYINNDTDAGIAAVSSVKGMTYVGNNVYTASVSSQQAKVTFTPEPLPGATVKVYSGNVALSSNSDGAYTVDNTGAAEQSYRMVVTSGKKTATYTLKINIVKSSECDVEAITGGAKTEKGYIVFTGFSDLASIDAQVSAGATYKLYKDFMCTQLYGDTVNMNGESCVFAYMKVTSEDGKNEAVHKLVLLSQATNCTLPTVTVTANKKTYTPIQTGEKELTVYLPNGVKEVTLSGKVDQLGDGGALTFYADYQRTVKSTEKVQLTQKNTRVYASSNAGAYVTYLPDSFDNISNGSSLVSVSSLDENGERVPVNVSMPPQDYTINLVSGRSVVTYKDQAKIASWALPYVKYLNENNFGIFVGDDKGNFNPTGNLTRYELAVVSTVILGLDVNQFSSVYLPFKDKIASWAEPYVKAAVGAGIMSGSSVDGELYFQGTRSATRAEAVTVFVSVALRSEGVVTTPALYYASKKYEIDGTYYASQNFVDDAQVAEWAVPYIHMAVSKYKMLSGTKRSDGSLALETKKAITREQVAVIIANFLGA